MKRIPVTIKAAIIGAIIGGVFALFISLLPYIIGLIKEVQKDNTIPSVYKLLDYDEDDGNGFLKIKTLLNFNEDVGILKSGYIDLVGDGNFEEYFIIFNDNSEIFESNCYIALTSKRFGRFELLFYDKTYRLEPFDIIFFSRDNRPQIMISIVGGTDLCLMFSIYEYDRIHKLNLLYESDLFERGSYYFINDKIYITSSSRHYIIEFDDRYKVKKYNDEIPIDFSPTKIISFSNYNKLKIYLNEEEIKFNEINENDSFETKEYIELNKNDILLINSNIKRGKRISLNILISGDDPIEFIDGYYTKIIFKEEGVYSIALRCDYIWYNLNVKVVTVKLSDDIGLD